MKKFLPVLFCCISLVSCSTMKGIFVTDSVKVPLLPVNSMCSPFESYQLMEGSLIGAENSFLETYTIADGKTIEINLMASTGQTLGKAVYDGKKTKLESSFLGNNGLVASYIFFDFQLCHASYEDLNNLLSKTGLIFEENKENGKTVRTIRQKDLSVYNIEISQDRIFVYNSYREYRYSLETL